MVSIISKVIQVLAAALPALLSWWEGRKAQQAQAAFEDRVADVRADPAGAWLRKFNSQANPGDNSGDNSGASGADQPDDHV